MSKQMLLRQLLRWAKVMVQGGLSETTRRCGNPGCACYRDPAHRHGPHLYLTYRTEKKNRSLYVAPEHAAQAAWNREQLRQRWEEEKGQTRSRRRRD
jgi:hypothetical protein